MMTNKTTKARGLKMNYPTAKNIAKNLNLDAATARKIRAALKDDDLRTANHLGEFFGWNTCRLKKTLTTTAARGGLSYLNAGDTYAGTIVFDHLSGRYRVCCLGDILENPRHAGRFE
jgi:hypothetical protein